MNYNINTLAIFSQAKEQFFNILEGQDNPGTRKIYVFPSSCN